MNLPTQDSATGRGLKTAIFAIIGFIVTFLLALIGAIKGVPGCSEAIVKVIESNFIQLAGTVGVGAGSASFIWNYFRKSVPNY